MKLGAYEVYFVTLFTGDLINNARDDHNRTDLMKRLSRQSNVSLIHTVLILEGVLQGCDVDAIVHKHLGCMLKLRIII